MTKLATVEVPTFIKRKHELAGLLKSLDEATPEAVKILVETMNADADKVGLKMKVDCATTLIELQVKVADMISKDQLTRTVAQIKSQGLSTQLEVVQGGRQAPRMDFSTVQTVGDDD